MLIVSGLFACNCLYSSALHYAFFYCTVLACMFIQSQGFRTLRWDQSILSLPVSPRNESIPQSIPRFAVGHGANLPQDFISCKIKPGAKPVLRRESGFCTVSDGCKYWRAIANRLSDRKPWASEVPRDQKTSLQSQWKASGNRQPRSSTTTGALVARIRTFWDQGRQ